MKKIIIILFLTLLLVSCGITDFEMPSWDVELTSIPLMNEDFPASDLEGENIIIEDGNLIALVEDQLEETTPELSKIIVDSTPIVPVLSNIPVEIRFEIQSINTNTSFRIIEGSFESGQMNVEYTGEVNDFQVLHIVFNQLITEEDEIFTLALKPNDFTDNLYIIELAGLTLIDQEIDGEFWLIDIEVEAETSGGIGEDLGAVQLTIDDELFFSEFTGFIDDVQTLDSETDVEIEYPSNIENAVILAEISMYFDVYNKIGFEFELMGDLVAYRDGVAIDTIKITDGPDNDLADVDFSIHACHPDSAEALTHIEIIDNERVNQMLRKMPDNIAFLNPTYKVSNLDENVPGFVSNQHTIRSDYRIEIPLRASFHDDFLIYPDQVYEVEISEDNQDLIDERVNNASIEVEVLNDFPMGGVLDLFVSSQELSADADSLALAELQFLGYDIQVSELNQSYEIELSKEDFNLFLNEKVFMRTRVRFFNSDGFVAILLEDNLSVKGQLNISIKVD
ncbi:hypothetical protein JEZ13_10025 [bacterium]|nr:hypothetical protein [bacterium]